MDHFYHNMKNIKADEIKMEEFDKNLAEVVINSSKKFDNRFFNAVKDANSNQIWSSYSVSSVLAMILHGACGNTAMQLRESLGLENESELEKFTKNYKMVAYQLKSNENFTLNSANRVYFAQDDVLDEKYLKSTKDHYLAEPIAMNFSNEVEARTSINKWVEVQTNSKIKDLIAKNILNSLTKLVLVNAIHFKGNWDIKFQKEITRSGNFHVSKDKVVKTDLMFSNEKYPYLHLTELKTKVLEVPYKGQQLSMVLLLPEQDSSLIELEKALEKTDLNEILKKMIRPGLTDVELTLPKFKIESELDLVDNLKAMGITDMFDETKADFSKMTGGENKDLYVSKVVQKAFIEVNEDGAEAAAATAAMMINCCAMDIPPSFTCDRPFMFMIRDNLTGITLFSGHVTDPTSQ